MMSHDERGGPLRRGDDIPIYSRSRRKPILCLDFDGVIHSYKSGWKGETIIYDPPVDGALDFIQAALEHFRVMIYSSRSSSPGGIAAMKEWLFGHCRNQHHRDFWWLDIEWPASKPAAKITIDDRAILFTGKFPPLEELINFKTWTEQETELK